jgi:hypothetical protein
MCQNFTHSLCSSPGCPVRLHQFWSSSHLQRWHSRNETLERSWRELGVRDLPNRRCQRNKHAVHNIGHACRTGCQEGIHNLSSHILRHQMHGKIDKRVVHQLPKRIVVPGSLGQQQLGQVRDTSFHHVFERLGALHGFTWIERCTVALEDHQHYPEDLVRFVSM